jgi:peptide/nickel transport system permease protein
LFKYTIKKLMASIPVLLGVSVMVFMIMHLTPGDPARIIAGPEAYEEDIEAIREKLGLNDPIHVQYLRFLGNAVQGDFGTSLRSGRVVSQELLNRFPFTIELAFFALVFAAVPAVFLGVMAAVRRNSIFDTVSMSTSLIGLSMPNFWLGIMLMLLFALKLGWLPPSGRGGPIWTLEGFKHVILPALTLGISAMATIARLTRSSMLEVLSLDYVRTARSKGLSERIVIYRHALRNAMIPVITILGLQMGFLLGGSVITETVFNWPGVGVQLVQGINSRDFPVVQGGVLLVASVFVFVNLLVDLMYGLIDPRIRYN